MRHLILRLIVNALVLAGTAALLPGIHIRDNAIGTLLVVAIIFGLLNALIKPFLVILSCPLVILTFGLFLVIINGVVLLLTQRLSGGRWTVDGLGWAVLGGLVISIAGSVLEDALGLDDDDSDGEHDDD